MLVNTTSDVRHSHSRVRVTRDRTMRSRLHSAHVVTAKSRPRESMIPEGRCSEVCTIPRDHGIRVGHAHTPRRLMHPITAGCGFWLPSDAIHEIPLAPTFTDGGLRDSSSWKKRKQHSYVDNVMQWSARAVVRIDLITDLHCSRRLGMAENNAENVSCEYILDGQAYLGSRSGQSKSKGVVARDIYPGRRRVRCIRVVDVCVRSRIKLKAATSRHGSS